MAGEEIIPPHAHTAAEFSGALGIVDQLVTQDAHGIIEFGFFHGSVLGVLKMGLHGIHAVGTMGGPVSSRDGLVVGEILPGAGMGAPECEIAHDTLAAGHHPLRHGRRQGLEHEVAQVDGHLPAGGDRGGVFGVDDGAGPGADIHEPVQPVIDRNIGVHEALQDVDDGRIGLGEGRVGGGFALRVAVAQIHGNLSPIDVDSHPEADGSLRDAVAVHPGLRGIGAVGELLELGLNPALCVVEQPVHVTGQLVRAVFHQQFPQPPGAQPVGGRLGPEIPGNLMHPAEIGADDGEYTGVDHPVTHEPHRGNDQPFLVDFARDADAARRAAAHVHMVGDIGHEAENRPVVKNRGDQGDVVEVHAAGKRIVAEQAVAGLQILQPVLFNDEGDDMGQRSQMGRLGERLGHRAAIAVEKRARKIAACLNVGRVGGPAQGGAHFLRDCQQAVADDLEPHRIQPGAQR